MSVEIEFCSVFRKERKKIELYFRYVLHHVSSALNQDLHNQTDIEERRLIINRTQGQQEERTPETKWLLKVKTSMKQHKCTCWKYKEARATRGMLIYERRTSQKV
ncbi:hypothetical protein HA466_0165300 [Hirschfeldia incana]|nr:hypothetical protein HA466_0165300 [Hirschfeldia incana]